jgi:hypothetical protein
MGKYTAADWTLYDLLWLMVKRPDLDPHLICHGEYYLVISRGTGVINVDAIVRGNPLTALFFHAATSLGFELAVGWEAAEYLQFADENREWQVLLEHLIQEEFT